MNTNIYDPALKAAFAGIQNAFQTSATKNVPVNGQNKTIPYPFPSPGDWRDTWIYFLMIDRFNNPANPPASQWNQRYGYRQGGTFKGIEAQLGYLFYMGVGAI
jgi:hypothetical protein